MLTCKSSLLGSFEVQRCNCWFRPSFWACTKGIAVRQSLLRGCVHDNDWIGARALARNSLGNLILRPEMERALRITRVQYDTGVEEDHSSRVSGRSSSHVPPKRNGVLSMALRASAFVILRRVAGLSRRRVISSASGPRTRVRKGPPA